MSTEAAKPVVAGKTNLPLTEQVTSKPPNISQPVSHKFKIATIIYIVHIVASALS